jgi:hypothetical protein
VRVRIKTSVATLVGTIANKYAGLTSEGELMSSIGTKKGVTKATKGTEQCVVRFCVTGEGRRLIRKMEVRKESTQYLGGKPD